MVYVPPDPPVTPYLMVGNGHRALDWYVRAFGAREVDRNDTEDGRLGHAMLTLANGGSIYVADEFPEYGGEQDIAPKGVTLHLQVDDVDAWVARARTEGACTIREPVDEFYGRHAKLRDPFGHVWSLTGPKRDES